MDFPSQFFTRSQAIIGASRILLICQQYIFFYKQTNTYLTKILISKYYHTRRYSTLWAPTYSSSRGLVAFGHLEGLLGPLDTTPLPSTISSTVSTVSTVSSTVSSTYPSFIVILIILTNCAATQWLLGLATWQQCKKRDGEGEGRGPARVWGFDKVTKIPSIDYKLPHVRGNCWRAKLCKFRDCSSISWIVLCDKNTHIHVSTFIFISGSKV